MHVNDPIVQYREHKTAPGQGYCSVQVILVVHDAARLITILSCLLEVFQASYKIKHLKLGHVHSRLPAVQCRPCDRPCARRPAALQTTTEVSVQNNTGPLGGPVIIIVVMVVVVVLVVVHKLHEITKSSAIAEGTRDALRQFKPSSTAALLYII